MNPEISALNNRPVIIGGGAAGLMTALQMAPEPVLLLSKAPLGAEASSLWAQGGLAAAMGDDDDPALHLADTPWHQAMRFVATLPKDAHVLADSGHAWRYGTSVRVSSGRDVFIEETKDSAVAIYSRDVAVRLVERIRALGDLSTRAPDDIVRLGEQYGLTHVVTEGRMPLQPVFENAQFRVYALPAPVRLAGDAGPR